MFTTSLVVEGLASLIPWFMTKSKADQVKSHEVLCTYHHFRAASLVASASGSLGEPSRCRFPIWPEWNEAEVNREKWDAAKGGKGGKMRDSPLIVSVVLKIIFFAPSKRLYKSL